MNLIKCLLLPAPQSLNMKRFFECLSTKSVLKGGRGNVCQNGFHFKIFLFEPSIELHGFSIFFAGPRDQDGPARHRQQDTGEHARGLRGDRARRVRRTRLRQHLRQEVLRGARAQRHTEGRPPTAIRRGNEEKGCYINLHMYYRSKYRVTRQIDK